MEASPQRRCSACKTPIERDVSYWTCSVSTCNRKRTALSFCSVSCWEVHLPVANHRKAWAVEQEPDGAPAQGAAPRSVAKREPRRVLTRPVRARAPEPRAPEPVLIVASRLKEYIRARSDFSTADGVLDPLSAIVRRVCDQAIRSARAEGRRTVLERDIPADR